MDFYLQSNVSVFYYAVWVCHSFSTKEQASFHFMASVLSTVTLESKKIKSVTVSLFPPSIVHEMMGPDAMILLF